MCPPEHFMLPGVLLPFQLALPSSSASPAQMTLVSHTSTVLAARTKQRLFSSKAPVHGPFSASWLAESGQHDSGRTSWLPHSEQKICLRQPPIDTAFWMDLSKTRAKERVLPRLERGASRKL
ncbi:hypothetical protein HDK77DRAFT_436409 [Phyllosticta capitalensis]